MAISKSYTNGFTRISTNKQESYRGWLMYLSLWQVQQVKHTQGKCTYCCLGPCMLYAFVAGVSWWQRNRGSVSAWICRLLHVCPEREVLHYKYFIINFPYLSGSYSVTVTTETNHKSVPLWNTCIGWDLQRSAPMMDNSSFAQLF